MLNSVADTEVAVPSLAAEAELIDRVWERVRGLFPVPKPTPKGGRPRHDDRACLAGIVYVLRSGCQWRGPAGRVPVRGHLLAPARRLGGRRDLGAGVGRGGRGAGRRGPAGHRRVAHRRHLRPGPKGRHEVGKSKVGKWVKVELVTDANGVPIGAATAAANVPETALIGPALDSIPEAVELPDGVLVMADKAYDSDSLREDLAADGFTLLSPHRKNRKRPPTNDGRRMRRYKRRWKVERTIGWLHGVRRLLVRHEYYSIVFDGFVDLALALITLSMFLKPVLTRSPQGGEPPERGTRTAG